MAVIFVQCTNLGRDGLRKVSAELVRIIPVGESMKVYGRKRTVDEMKRDLSRSLHFQIWLIFCAGKVGENVQAFETRVRDEEYLEGLDVHGANRILYTQLAPNVYLNCNEAGEVVITEAGHADQP